MKKNYNLKKLKWTPNPYSKHLKKSVTIRMDEDVVEYFKSLAESEHIPYQSLINKFLRFCKESKLSPAIKWEEAA
jgi:uncharacterized protein (DUF4415 family)